MREISLGLFSYKLAINYDLIEDPMLIQGDPGISPQASQGPGGRTPRGPQPARGRKEGDDGRGL